MKDRQTEQANAQYRVQQNDFNILKMRLDTQPLLDQIEQYMRGARWTIEQGEDGKIKSRKIILGVPKANDLGIQSIMNWLSLTINPQVVQGNFPVDKHGISQMYDVFIYRFQLDLMNHLMINLYEWGVQEDETQGIVDSIMTVIVPYMSRLIGNQERKSYAKTMESKETHTIGGGSPPMFKS